MIDLLIHTINENIFKTTINDLIENQIKLNADTIFEE
jgi:hypothetical protein